MTQFENFKEPDFEPMKKILLKISNQLDRMEMNWQENVSESVPSEPMTISQMCKYLNISEPTLKKNRDSGLPYYKIGSRIRFNVENVMIFLNKNKPKSYSMNKR